MFPYRADREPLGHLFSATRTVYPKKLGRTIKQATTRPSYTHSLAINPIFYVLGGAVIKRHRAKLGGARERTDRDVSQLSSGSLPGIIPQVNTANLRFMLVGIEPNYIAGRYTTLENLQCLAVDVRPRRRVWRCVLKILRAGMA